MSGHSKWATIKHKKGKTDAARGKLFSKLSRAITVAARDGGPDPAMNIALANAIEKAKAESVPKDNIERAIQRGVGGAEGASYESIVYEGYGPAGVAIIVEVLTDNRNRSAAEVRNIFSKHGGQLAQPGAVAWGFERRGSIVVDGTKYDEDDIMTAAIEAGADDVEQDGAQFQVLTQPSDFASVRDALTAAGIEPDSADLTMIPKNTVKLEENDARKTMKIMDALEDSDDVQEVYANFDIPEDVLEALAG
ncbi:MAG TPA: YebC/PmpR family DNA-binding transcriptional regulator [Thermoleophilia bacterium]|nr:YebC/PmpR family DNA-binding transcriptional regulator [Acidobacteriota bacterium]NLT93306.1 YebC/PmpR family DNA-binding transcriptional regulator [Actinomycetota bacterium]OPZ47193.1 MAG: putative transcriptional regulatory protein [Actinobacteria bacterium ADurb.BinA094]HOU29200.1 YebC/PmpR family DNA-binding transcriptional regulator [Thermoleophilia bacterium]HQF52602.1 YebC/PmpR family DNA-binding transcriptional regulator [Thermoleophilia bacterium]